MKNPVIFTASISQTIRGPQQPVPYKAGFFYVSAKGGLSVLNSSGPSLPNPKKGNMPAKVDLLTAVFGGSLFYVRLQTSTSPHHAHRNHALPATTPTRQNDAHLPTAPSSQAQQPRPKSQLFDADLGKVLTLAAIGLAVLSTLIF